MLARPWQEPLSRQDWQRPRGQGWGGCPQQIPASSRLSEDVGRGGSTGEPVALQSARLLCHVDFWRHRSLALETAHLLIFLVCLELTSLPSLHLPSWEHLYLESGFCRRAPRAEALLCASPGSLHPSWDGVLCFPRMGCGEGLSPGPQRPCPQAALLKPVCLVLSPEVNTSSFCVSH